MKTSRATETIRFDQGISMAEYNEQPFGQSKAKSEPPILPGSTTVSEALMGVFPESESVNGEIMRALVTRIEKASRQGYPRRGGGSTRIKRAFGGYGTL